MNESKTLKISQSLMKSLLDYKEGKKCGLQIEAQYVNGVQFPSSEAMELGNYFEFICTGSKARDGHVPQPILKKNGEPTSKYVNAQEQKNNFDRIMKKYGFELKYIDHHFSSKECSGIADIIAERDGQKVIIDTKYSGLLENKWDDIGWHNDSIEHKDRLLIQAVHYKVLAEEEWGIVNIPFFFFVFCSTNPVDCKIFEVICDEATLEQHKINIQGAKTYLNSLLTNGFKALPSVKECSTCPLAEKCEHFTDVPLIQKVYY